MLLAASASAAAASAALASLVVRLRATAVEQGAVREGWGCRCGRRLGEAQGGDDPHPGSQRMQARRSAHPLSEELPTHACAWPARARPTAHRALSPVHWRVLHVQWQGRQAALDVRQRQAAAAAAAPQLPPPPPQPRAHRPPTFRRLRGAGGLGLAHTDTGVPRHPALVHLGRRLARTKRCRL